MANEKWTKQQLQAIEHRNGTLLVSAAAGSGKTAVLVERLLRHVIDDKQEISGFLMITYTNAAAAELRAKILSALSERASLQVRDAYMRRQLALAHTAHISTIHAFCAGLLRTHGHILRINSDFRILDESEGQLLRNELAEEAVEECYGQSWFVPTAQAMFSDRDDRRLLETVLSLHEKSRSQIYPNKWLEKLKKDFSDASESRVDDTIWGKYLLERAEEILVSLDELNQRGRDMMLGDAQLEKAYLPTFESDAQLISQLLSSVKNGWDAAYDAFCSVEYKSLGRLVKYPDEEKKELVKDIRDQVKSGIEKLRKSWFCSNSEKLTRDLSGLVPVVNGLVTATQLLDEKFSHEKLRRNALDYSDLEHCALELLVEDYDDVNDIVYPTAFAKELSADWTEIMVDEYQDSNGIQDVIFRALSKDEKNLVMVGDIKQSIYRFRLADPQIFLKKYREFAPYDEAVGDEPRTVVLSKNFRSRAQVLDSCNSLFSRIMSRNLGDLDYTPAEYLYLGAEYADYPEQNNSAQAIILDVQTDADSQDGEIPPGARQVEAEWIAEKIKSMMDDGCKVQEKDGTARKMRWSDVVILLRSMADKAQIYEKALTNAGIPCASEKASGLLDAPEVSMVISVLTVIDNPLNEVALVGALRSPLFAFTADDLSYVRRNGDSFMTAMNRVSRESSELGVKCRNFIDLILQMRELSSDLSCDKLIWQLYCKTNALGMVGALPSGSMRQENLLRFYRYAQSFEQNGFKGLYLFLERIARLAEKGDNIAVPASGSGDAVKIMSIHKSKGLEFPIVFLADINHQFNTQDFRARVLVHPELGLGMKVMHDKINASFPSIARLAIEEKLTCEMKSEEMRVLYVALTRAREKLFCVCTMVNGRKKLGNIYTRVAGAPAKGFLSAEQLSGNGTMPWLVAPILTASEGNELRENLGAFEPADAQSINFEVEYIRTSGNPMKTEKISQKQESTLSFGSALDFEKRFEYVYPYLQAAQAPSKITATGMRALNGETGINAGELAQPENKNRAFKRPEFVKEKSLTQAEKGIAAHLAMQLMDFSRCNHPDGVKSEIDRLFAMGQLSVAEYESINPEKLMSFFNSQIGKMVLSAEKLYREFRFSVLVPADGIADGETMLLQGVADLFYETDEGIVLVDFKTDSYITPALAEERYATQLSAYAYALSEIFAKPVVKCVLFFLQSGETIELKQAIRKEITEINAKN